MQDKRSYREFKKSGKQLTTEQKIEGFVIRNSKNGFFIKVKTMPFKFEISEDRTWDVVGELLSNGTVEATHDGHAGDMNLCEAGKTYEMLDLEQKKKKMQKQAGRKTTTEMKRKNTTCQKNLNGIQNVVRIWKMRKICLRNAIS